MINGRQLGRENSGRDPKEEAASLRVIRSELAARVRARSPEVEQAFIARISASGTMEIDAEYLVGLPAALRESIDYALNAVEEGESWSIAVPPAVAAQIHMLARGGATLEATLHGYSVVHNVLLEFMTEEMGPLPQEVLGQMLRVQSQQSDKLMMAFANEYASEMARLDRSSAQRLAERVQQVLAGERVEGVELDYDLDGWHLGIVALGEAAELTVRRLAEELGCRLLSVRRTPETLWAWLGAQRSISLSELERLASARFDASVSLAIGEPRQGIDGWRLTHREAQTALAIMLRKPQRLTRCSDVVLSAALIRDEETRGFLLDAYLGPLDKRKDAEALRQTLRSYLAVGCNAASAAASLGVDRHTVQRRLGKIEESLGRPLDSCRVELEVALRVEELLA